MSQYFDEFKEKIEEDMPRMTNKAIYACVGSINAFMEMGFIDRKEWDVLIETLLSKGYITMEDYAEIIDYGT